VAQTLHELQRAIAVEKSWRFDSRDPASAPVKFDQLALQA
jgi:hypothetical protein